MRRHALKASTFSRLRKVPNCGTMKALLLMTRDMKRTALGVLGGTALGMLLGAAVLAAWQERRDEEALARLPAVAEIAARVAANGGSVSVPERLTSFMWADPNGYTLDLNADQVLEVSNLLRREETVPERAEDGVARYGSEFAIIREALERRGWSRDEANSSDGPGDAQFHDYIEAYAKDDRRCVAALNGDGWMSLSFWCGSLKQRGLDEQRRIQDALSLRGKDTVTSVTARDGDYLEVSEHYRRAGQALVLKREGDGYRLLLRSQEAPPCELVDRERIPLTVLSSLGSSCYLPDGSYRPAPQETSNPQ